MKEVSSEAGAALTFWFFWVKAKEQIQSGSSQKVGSFCCKTARRFPESGRAAAKLQEAFRGCGKAVAKLQEAFRRG